MSENDPNSSIKRKYNDLSLDLNLDQVTADEAWANYENIQLKYTLEGEQLTWLACALYAACRRRSVPTVGGRPGNMIQGNCVSLTRMLQHCNLPLTEFIKKMKSWLAMSHFDEGFCRRVDLLERNFAVSNNIFKKYKPIFLDLFKNPANDLPRPPRSRKQRRPPCNSTELFHFCWTLYILIKGKYPSIPQDLVSCYSLLLASIDLIYGNVVLSNRKDLINPECEGVPSDFLNSESSGNELSSWPVSIMDYLCEKFDGVLVETKVVREYYWNKHIRDLIEKKVLKGGVEGTGLLEQTNFDHNVKEVKNAYEEYLLSYGEFDERMFLNEDDVVTGTIGASPPSAKTTILDSPVDASMRQARRNLVQSFEGDYHLVPPTPITGRRYTINRPAIGNTPLTVVTSGLQKLYALLAGRKNSASEELQEMFKTCKENPEERIEALVTEMSDEFCRLYTQPTEDYNGPSMDFAKMRLQMGQILYYTFLEHILVDEKRRGVDLMLILKEELFHRTLFTCCLEIVLRSYNDPRRFPWSLQVGRVEPYYFIRIIEPVIRSEKQSDNQLSRELVKHLKGIEEQILDSLAWKGESPLWQILQNGNMDIPSCQDVNFSDQLETEMNSTAPIGLATTPMSPATKLVSDKATPINLQLSPLTTISERFQSPVNQSSARRTLFPPSTSATSTQNTVPTLTLSRSSGLKPAGATVVTTSSLSVQKPSSLVTVQVKENTATALYNVQENSQGASVPPDSSAENSTEKIVPDPPSTDKKKDRPKRNGSLALFCRKFYTLANMRLRELCDRLDVNEKELRKKIWTCFEHSIIHYTELMQDRHMDQMIMCAIYITCKVTGNDRIFQEIMKHYRSQPQAASHVYRSVLISRSNTPNSTTKTESGGHHGCAPPATPSQMTGTSSSFDSGERGDLILFYNQVYVQKMKAFALKFRAAQEGDLPPLSPLPVVRHTPVSPRRRISTNHSVYINNLSPVKGSTAMSPRKPLPYYFNRSPAKDLRVINNMLKTKGVGAKRLLADTDFGGLDIKRPLMGGMGRRIQGVLGDRLSSTPTPDLQQDSNGAQEASALPQNGHATEPVTEEYSSTEQP